MERSFWLYPSRNRPLESHLRLFRGEILWVCGSIAVQFQPPTNLFVWLIRWTKCRVIMEEPTYFFLWRFLRRRFLRLCVAILWRFLFLPLGISYSFNLLNWLLCFDCQIEVNLCIDRITHHSEDIAHFEQPSRILGLQRYQFFAFFQCFWPLLWLF